MIRTLGLLLIFALPSFTQAEEIYPCDTSCSGLYSKARQLSSSLPQGTTFSVVDVETWGVATYVADQRYSRTAGEYIEFPRKVATTSNVINAANRLKAALDEIEQTGIAVPPSIAENAHSVVARSQAENHVGDFLTENIDLIDKSGALVGAMLEIFDKIIDINVVVEVEFADGSTAKFVLTGLAASGGAIPGIEFEFELLDGSAVDSDGNNIPTTPEETVGERRFNSEFNQDLFRGVAELYGIEFKYGGCKNINTTICVSSGGSFSCTTFTVCY